MSEELARFDPIVYNDVKEVLERVERDYDMKALRDLRVLVTGGAGFIGSWLVDALYALGADVTVVDSLSTGSLENIAHLKEKVKPIVRDVLSYEPGNEKYDVILHLAARPSPDDYMEHPVESLLVSGEATRKLLDYARKWDAVFLFTSTSEVYGDAKVIPTPEDYWGYVNPIGPRSCYDEGKRYAEALCMAYHRQYGVDVRITRIFNTYGPRLDWKNPGYGRVIVKFIVQALKGEPITVHGDGLQTRSFCYIADTLEAHLRVLLEDKMKGEVVNIGNPEEVKIIDLAHLVIELTGSKSIIVHTPPRPDDPRRRVPCIDKAREMLKWKPQTPLREGLVKTIEWVKVRIK